MKHLRILTIAILAMVFVACSSSDNSTDDPVDDGPTEVDKTPNLQATGSSANDILSNNTFDKLLIEAAFVEGFRPTNQTMANFQDYLRTHSFKTDIEITYRELPSPDEETLTLEEIRDLEDENRTAYNDGSTLAIYIYFADALSDNDDINEGLITLGAVYRNTSMIIYESAVRTIAGRSLTITPTDVETATLNHEFGHLFGLVNLGTVPINNHEDVDAPNHCNEDPCLMRAQLEFGAADKRSLSAQEKPELQSACALNGLKLLEQMELSVARGAAAAPGLDLECRIDLESNGGRPVLNN